MIESAAAFGLLAGALGAADTVPYVRDTLRRSTVPHRGSWLIWGVLEVVAVQSQRVDGARWSLVPLVTQAVGTCLVFALSVRLGTGGLSRVDLALIAVAGVGVAGWLALDEPVIATVCGQAAVHALVPEPLRQQTATRREASTASSAGRSSSWTRNCDQSPSSARRRTTYSASSARIASSSGGCS